MVISCLSKNRMVGETTVFADDELKQEGGEGEMIVCRDATLLSS